MAKRRVLVYDDEAEAIARLLVLLTLLGHEAVGTLDVSEGAEAMEVAPVDLLLARQDLRGYDLAVLACARRPRAEIVFIAGAHAPPGGPFQHCPVLTEPFTRERLEALLLPVFALHAVRVAAARYVQAVRAACSHAGCKASTEALAAAAEHIEVVRHSLEAPAAARPPRLFGLVTGATIMQPAADCARETCAAGATSDRLAARRLPGQGARPVPH